MLVFDLVSAVCAGFLAWSYRAENAQAALAWLCVCLISISHLLEHIER